jgi:hypothetical protein
MYWADTAGQGSWYGARVMRKGLLMSALVGGPALAAPAAAQAVELGYWRVAATTTVKYDWTQTSTQPCAEVGPGNVTATVSGRSGRFKLGYFARGGFRHWAIYPRLMRASGGRITATDGTHQNPPEDSFSTCTPTNKAGCITRAVNRQRTFVSVQGKNARRNVGAVFTVNGLLSAFESLDRECNYGGMRDFSQFVGAPSADYGSVLLAMPPAGGIGRRAFTVTRTQTSTGRSSGTSARTSRRVTLRFTPA